MKRQTAKKLTALAICVLFIAGVLLSSAAVFVSAGHEHDRDGSGGSCTACAHLAANVNRLKLLSAALAGAALALGVFRALLSVLAAFSSPPGFSTLVRLKIRMNN